MVAADSGELRLVVRGQGFQPGWQVLWNGSPRPTEYLDSYRLEAILPAEDTATPSLSFVGVWDPERSAVVRQATAFWVTVDLWNNDFVYDAQRRRLWVAVPSQQGARGRSVALLDPETGVADGFTPLPADDEPQLLALSDDARFLYVSAPGRIHRLDTRTLTFDLTFAIPPPAMGSPPSEAVSMKVVPAHPESLVVSVRSSGPAYQCAIALDSGVPRPQALPSDGGCPLLVGWADAHTLVGSGYSGTFYKVLVDGNGLRLLQTVPDVLGLAADCVLEAGLLFCPSGVVVDPAKPSYVRDYPAAGFVATLPAIDRVVFLNRGQQLHSGGPIMCPLVVLRASSAELVSSWLVPLPGGLDRGPMIRWGENGLAYRDAGFNRMNRPTERIFLWRLTGDQ